MSGVMKFSTLMLTREDQDGRVNWKEIPMPSDRPLDRSASLIFDC